MTLFVIAGMAIDLAAAENHAPSNTWITLGTAGGPLSDKNRAQPANALQVGSQLYLVDAGDGTTGQLAKAGFRVTDVDALFLSHLHFDHTGGVLAILGLRMQLNARKTLHIFGPPGIREYIDGMLHGMRPVMNAAYGMPGQSWKPFVEVSELTAGSVVELDGMTVTAAENSHFKIPEHSGLAEKAKSLSFRFDLEDRSIVYTGDTGPSESVEILAKGADLLISEMMDIPVVLDSISQTDPAGSGGNLKRIEWHFRAHHLLPEQVGELAAAAGVTTVVLTHVLPAISQAEQASAYHKVIQRHFDGEVLFADDLAKY